MRLDFLLHKKLIMDHHSLAFQLFLFLMFYGTFEWIRHELNVTQGQQEQVSDSTHTVKVVNETIGQTDDSIVSTSSTSTNIQVHLETEPALHTDELVSVVQQAEEPTAVAELTNTELSAIAPIEPALTESSTPTLPTSATPPAIPSVALGSSHDALFPSSESTIGGLLLSTQSECPINTLFTFTSEVKTGTTSIEPVTAEVAGLIEPAIAPQTGSTTKPSAKKRQSRQSKKTQVAA
jgi:hypothetical protein